MGLPLKVIDALSVCSIHIASMLVCRSKTIPPVRCERCVTSAGYLHCLGRHMKRRHLLTLAGWMPDMLQVATFHYSLKVNSPSNRRQNRDRSICPLSIIAGTALIMSTANLKGLIDLSQPSIWGMLESVRMARQPRSNADEQSLQHQSSSTQHSGSMATFSDRN